jgi:hypothetical protein
MVLFLKRGFIRLSSEEFVFCFEKWCFWPEEDGSSVLFVLFWICLRELQWDCGVHIWIFGFYCFTELGLFLRPFFVLFLGAFNAGCFGSKLVLSCGMVFVLVEVDEGLCLLHG